MDNVDKLILSRRIQKARNDVLNNWLSLLILVILRQKANNILGIYFVSRKIKRTAAQNDIAEILKNLISVGYVRQNSRGTLYYITPSGLQALKDFNNAIECADYVNYNKKAPISKNVKRPGL